MHLIIIRLFSAFHHSLYIFALFGSPRYAPQQQATPTTSGRLSCSHVEIRKLQQENGFLRKQLAPEPSTTDIPPSPSGRITSPTVSSLSRSSPSSYKLFPSPNNASTSLPKIAKPKRDKSQPSLTAIARQFSSPSKPTSFKLIHVPIRHCLSLQQLRSSVCRLHVNTRRILDIHYSDRNLVSFLTHIGYETEIRLQLSKFNITVRCNFDPLDPSIIRDPTLINEPIDRRLQHAR
ncbi:hypothetical protein G6F44_011881 [Rhizopus delemar]|nr:hypothetical protein G6F44_011881 [Rhizopus delemar]